MLDSTVNFSLYCLGFCLLSRPGIGYRIGVKFTKT